MAAPWSGPLGQSQLRIYAEAIKALAELAKMLGLRADVPLVPFPLTDRC